MGEAGLRRHRRAVVLVGLVLLRVLVFPQVALSVVFGAGQHLYTNPVLAGACYVVALGWSVVFLVLAVCRDPLPAWVALVDTALVAICLLALSLAVAPEFFLSTISDSDLEALAIASSLSTAILLPPKRAAVCCLVLAGAYWVAQVPATQLQGYDVMATLSVLCWQLGASWFGGMVADALRKAAAQVDAATSELVASRERHALEQERARHFEEQSRRYRALHDGPLSLLTALAGRGPVAHPDAEIRRQCAVNANLLRGLTPDEPNSTLTDLSLALTEACADHAARGVRVHYQFSDLPADLSPEVVGALSGASREALNNVASHAGTDRAWLTALPSGGGVVVEIVDRGVGFDPVRAVTGRGLPESILGRMREVGGLAEVDSAPEQGTRIKLRWPG
ncbi:sensor histidine kinase [Kutzneria albida]|uniref:Histidine kinase/HSP90-like ATPase domain-containing protein n=1 Tax=Kutzneria albida DSM 43870 TaxID=1449976 RepID=W5WAP4_9PSEU|nr:hypothetical protein [Kutzneria albida]AHH98183.1 hypothetical protein KALB_4821 [Kutzneria albida DSM 43870]